jgi:hypothetical protein
MKSSGIKKPEANFKIYFSHFFLLFTIQKSSFIFLEAPAETSFPVTTILLYKVPLFIYTPLTLCGTP